MSQQKTAANVPKVSLAIQNDEVSFDSGGTGPADLTKYKCKGYIPPFIKDFMKKYNKTFIESAPVGRRRNRTWIYGEDAAHAKSCDLMLHILYNQSSDSAGKGMNHECFSLSKNATFIEHMQYGLKTQENSHTTKLCHFRAITHGQDIKKRSHDKNKELYKVRRQNICLQNEMKTVNKIFGMLASGKFRSVQSLFDQLAVHGKSYAWLLGKLDLFSKGLLKLQNYPINVIFQSLIILLTNGPKQLQMCHNAGMLMSSGGARDWYRALKSERIIYDIGGWTEKNITSRLDEILDSHETLCGDQIGDIIVYFCLDELYINSKIEYLVPSKKLTGHCREHFNTEIDDPKFETKEDADYYKDCLLGDEQNESTFHAAKLGELLIATVSKGKKVVSYLIGAMPHCGYKKEKYYFDMFENLFKVFDKFRENKRAWFVIGNSDGDADIRSDKKRMYVNNVQLEIESSLQQKLYLLSTRMISKHICFGNDFRHLLKRKRGDDLSVYDTMDEEMKSTIMIKHRLKPTIIYNLATKLIDKHLINFSQNEIFHIFKYSNDNMNVNKACQWFMLLKECCNNLDVLPDLLIETEAFQEKQEAIEFSAELNIYSKTWMNLIDSLFNISLILSQRVEKMLLFAFYNYYMFCINRTNYSTNDVFFDAQESIVSIVLIILNMQINKDQFNDYNNLELFVCETQSQRAEEFVLALRCCKGGPSMTWLSLQHNATACDLLVWLLNQRPDWNYHTKRFGFERTTPHTYDKNQKVAQVNLPQIFNKVKTIYEKEVKLIQSRLNDKYDILCDIAKLHQQSFNLLKPWNEKESKVRDFYLPYREEDDEKIVANSANFCNDTNSNSNNDNNSENDIDVTTNRILKFEERVLEKKAQAEYQNVISNAILKSVLAPCQSQKSEDSIVNNFDDDFLPPLDYCEDDNDTSNDDSKQNSDAYITVNGSKMSKQRYINQTINPFVQTKLSKDRAQAYRGKSTFLTLNLNENDINDYILSEGDFMIGLVKKDNIAFAVVFVPLKFKIQNSERTSIHKHLLLSKNFIIEGRLCKISLKTPKKGDCIIKIKDRNRFAYVIFNSELTIVLKTQIGNDGNIVSVEKMTQIFDVLKQIAKANKQTEIFECKDNLSDSSSDKYKYVIKQFSFKHKTSVNNSANDNDTNFATNDLTTSLKSNDTNTRKSKTCTRTAATGRQKLADHIENKGKRTGLNKNQYIPLLFFPQLYFVKRDMSWIAASKCLLADGAYEISDKIPKQYYCYKQENNKLIITRNVEAKMASKENKNDESNDQNKEEDKSSKKEIDSEEDNDIDSSVTTTNENKNANVVENNVKQNVLDTKDDNNNSNNKNDSNDINDQESERLLELTIATKWSEIEDLENVCSYCLRYRTCSFEYDKTNRPSSNCVAFYRYTTKSAQTYSTGRPSSNIPFKCPVCEKLIMRYLMLFHFDAKHPQIDKEVRSKFKIEEEELKKLSKYKLKGASYWQKQKSFKNGTSKLICDIDPNINASTLTTNNENVEQNVQNEKEAQLMKDYSNLSTITSSKSAKTKSKTTNNNGNNNGNNNDNDNTNDINDDINMNQTRRRSPRLKNKQKSIQQQKQVMKPGTEEADSPPAKIRRLSNM